MNTRELRQMIPSQAVSDGAGVRIKRTLGLSPQYRFDPFLMLDEFGSDIPGDYLAGFPDHPHRGFETITYMLEGHMLHEDHLGNRGDLKNGDVQWMSAGRGIIHSEMPQQEDGRMRGFQLWLNLPAAEKMQPPSYRDIPARDIPVVRLAGGAMVKVIAGQFVENGDVVSGPIQQAATTPVYLDVTLNSGDVFVQPTPLDHHALIYVYEGGLRVGDLGRELASGVAGLLTEGDQLSVKADVPATRFLVLTGQPLREPVAQWGPFVMNTEEEIQQALADYRSGRLVRGA